jgi:pyridinium-3,5-bisthiocarboxylic acid mononucleotide nickel chelatase
MSGQRFALIDPATGVSGDMLLGAVLELGAPEAWLLGLPARLGLSDVSISIARVMRASIQATKVTVTLSGATEGPGDVSLGDHGHALGSDHHHDHHDRGHNGHPHRHVGELIDIIAKAPLSPWVKERATAAFRFLAQAEGRIHGVVPDEVVLHEVGALDALVDIVGVVEGFEQLGVTDIRTRPVALGNGWVKTQHGLLPVPTPATSLLMDGLPVAPNGPVEGEATTPTGATLLKALTRPVPAGEWQAIRSGWGAGGRNPGAYPNAVKVTLAEAVPVPASDAMVMLVTDVDDMNPEYLDPLREALGAAGAVDVQSWATQSKKGRIGFRIEALVPGDRVDGVTEAFFRHSSTAGVRRWAVARSILLRDQWELESQDGSRVRMKTLHGPTGPRVKPEYDDVMAIAKRTGQPALELSSKYREEALRQVGGSRPSERHELEKESR